MALAAYCAENDNIQQLFSHHLGLVKNVLTFLSPIKEITCSISVRLAFNCDTLHSCVN